MLEIISEKCPTMLSQLITPDEVIAILQAKTYFVKNKNNACLSCCISAYYRTLLVV